MYVALIIVVFFVCWFAIAWIETAIKNRFLRIVIFVLLLAGYICAVDQLSSMQDRDTIREALLNDNCVTTNRLVEKPVLEKIGNEFLITNGTEQLFEYQCTSVNQYLKSPNLEQ